MAETPSVATVSFGRGSPPAASAEAGFACSGHVQFMASAVLESVYEHNDIELFCDEGKFHVHRLVLAAASPFLAALLVDAEAEGGLLPTEIIFENVSRSTLRHLLDYMYRGVSLVSREELDPVLNLATSLGVKGIASEFNMISMPKTVSTAKKRPAPASSSMVGSRIGVKQFKKLFFDGIAPARGVEKKRRKDNVRRSEFQREVWETQSATQWRQCLIKAANDRQDQERVMSVGSCEEDPNSQTEPVGTSKNEHPSHPAGGEAPAQTQPTRSHEPRTPEQTQSEVLQPEAVDNSHIEQPQHNAAGEAQEEPQQVTFQDPTILNEMHSNVFQSDPVVAANGTLLNENGADEDIFGEKDTSIDQALPSHEERSYETMNPFESYGITQGTSSTAVALGVAAEDPQTMPSDAISCMPNAMHIGSNTTDDGATNIYDAENVAIGNDYANFGGVEQFADDDFLTDDGGVFASNSRDPVMSASSLNVRGSSDLFISRNDSVMPTSVRSPASLNIEDRCDIFFSDC